MLKNISESATCLK